MTPNTVAVRSEPGRDADSLNELGQQRSTPKRIVDILRSLVLGIKGGVVATAVMTVFRMPITDSLPPTATFLAEYVGGEPPDEYTVRGLVLHVVYGVLASVPFAVAFDLRDAGPEVEKEKRGALWGFAYGVVLSVFGVHVILKRVLGMDLKPDERWIFHVGHVIFGLALGAYVGSNT